MSDELVKAQHTTPCVDRKDKSAFGKWHSLLWTSREYCVMRLNIKNSSKVPTVGSDEREPRYFCVLHRFQSSKLLRWGAWVGRFAAWKTISLPSSQLFCITNWKAGTGFYFDEYSKNTQDWHRGYKCNQTQPWRETCPGQSAHFNSYNVPSVIAKWI